MRTVVLAFKAFWFYKWSVRPNWRTLIDVSADNTVEAVQSWVAMNCVESLEDNAKNVALKLESAGRAYRWLVAEALAASGGILAVISANRLAT